MPRAVASLVLVLGLAACAAVREDEAPRTTPRLVWPQAPNPARIEWVAAFAGATDLGIVPSIWGRLAGLLTGRDEVRLVRPMGVAAEEKRIAVADPGAGVVHVFDLERRRALVLRSCAEAALQEPVAVAFFADRLYVADAAAARIHGFDDDGDCTASWALAPGSRPSGLAADRTRARLYVADVGAHRLLALDAHGVSVLQVGRRGSDAGEFNFPTWVAVDTAGDVYVTDALNFRVQRFDASGTLLSSFGQHGDGSGDMARPKGIGIGPGGEVFLVDALFDAVQIFDGEGQYLMMFGGRGEEPGRFWLPSGLAVLGDRIYVADSYNRRVQVFRILEDRPGEHP